MVVAFFWFWVASLTCSKAAAATFKTGTTCTTSVATTAGNASNKIWGNGGKYGEGGINGYNECLKSATQIDEKRKKKHIEYLNDSFCLPDGCSACQLQEFRS